MTNRPKMICFDMDGTIADLYGVDGWLELIEAQEAFPYEVAKPMWDMMALAEILTRLQEVGIEIRIITWLSKTATEQYKQEVREAKRNWLADYDFPYDHFHGIQYGRTKADAIYKALEDGETAWLIDDNAKVRNGWSLGETIDPTACDILEILSSLLDD